ncbi:MAG: metallophosphoesterase [Labilithrix sp.]|nr:metallophosphoesterase [Labilithrix sp.]
MAIFAIGDVHGCADELEELLGMLPLGDGSTVVMLGDYIDRGPYSRRVIETLIEWKAKHPIVTLSGNHEEMLREFLDGSNPQRVARFILNGGSSTLADFADDHGEWVIPSSHVKFLDELKLWHETDEHFFVHAGVPDIALKELDPVRDRDELLWIRRAFISSTRRWEKRIVHGHTPVNAVEVSASRINVDTACAYGGFLTAIELPSHRIYSVPRRTGLRPAFLRDKASRRAAVRFLGSVPVTIHHERHGDLKLETLNYSEIGMLLWSPEEADRTKQLLEQGEAVSGTVGDGWQVPFNARVVHSRKQSDGWQYGLAVDLEG